MAASQAIIGYGTKFAVETAPGSGSYFELGEVTNVTPPNQSVDQVDVTHMQSTGRYREFIQGLTDPGEMSVEINYVPGGDTELFIAAWRASGATRSSKITYPATVPAPAGAIDTFPTFVLGFTPTTGVADKYAATLNLKVAGAIVRS